MISLAFQQFRARWQRSLAVFVAVVLGVAFFAIALLAGGPLNHNLQVGVGQQIRGADLVVTKTNGDLSPADLAAIQSTQGVSSADFASVAPAEMESGGVSSFLLISELPSVPVVQDNIQLESGSWPERSGEVALSGNKMDEVGLGVGDQVSLYSWMSDETQTFTVVGEFESPTSLVSGRASALLEPGDFAQIVPNPYNYGVRVGVDDASNVSTVQSLIQTSLGTDYTVYTFDTFVDAEVAEFSGSTVALQVALGGFAVIALIASGIVIANSFEISLTQRVREIGLLRSVGATKRQVRALVIGEAFIIGAVASALGVLLAIGMVEIAGRLLWASGGSTGLEVTLASILAPFLVGVVATLVSAYGPAKTAMKVLPLQAIRQSEAPVESPKASRKRVIFSTITFVGGSIVMAVAVLAALNGGAQGGIPLMIGILGGAATFFAVLMSTQVILPRLSRWVGAFATKVFGVTGELASGNLGRNPRRSASAAAALLMGVTLMTIMTVGASSVRSTVVHEVEERQPIDLGIRFETDSQNTVDIERELVRWKEIDGVRNVVPIQVTELQLSGTEPVNMVGVSPEDARTMLRSDALETLSDDTIVINPDFAYDYGLKDGDRVEIEGADGSVSLEIRVARTGVAEPIISADTMNSVTDGEQTRGVWIRLHDDSSVGDVMEQVRAGLPLSVQLQVGGGASERESILDLLDNMLLVVVGLLAASVVIAVVGIGNTLTLSVIERTRESGMLRAMGLKRGQVRAMLALEGVAISLVGAFVGIVLGVVYGFAGATTLIGDAIGISLSIPWTQILLICLVAIASGLLASVLPARRALRIKPVEALSNIG